MKNRDTLINQLIARDGMRCAVTRKDVADPSDLEIDHIIPKNRGGTDDLDNLILVSRHVNADIGANERRRTELLVQELKERHNELTKREAENFEKEKAYRRRLEEQQRVLEEQQHMLENARLRMRSELADREKMLQDELVNQQKKFLDQKIQFQKQFEENENLLNGRLLTLEEERRNLTQQLQHREELVQKTIQELEQEKQKYTEESRKKIEHNSGAYVNEALLSLGESAGKYHSISRNWSLCGLISLVLGVIAAGYFGLVGLSSSPESEGMNWAHAAFFGFKGLIIVALFVAIAKYCFSYSQSFMHESLKNSERKHAINFGKFYLQSYGANAEWTQVREAFEHWNIAPPSAFSNGISEKFDPKIIEKAAQLIEVVGKIKPLGDAGSDEKKG